MEENGSIWKSMGMIRVSGFRAAGQPGDAIIIIPDSQSSGGNDELRCAASTALLSPRVLL
jgi:hypothetical protein